MELVISIKDIVKGIKYYDKQKPKNYIIYFDINNLYGHAMSQYLPYGGFKRVKNTDKIKQKLMKIKSNSSTGYILEVDLEHPQEFHDFIMIIH